MNVFVRGNSDEALEKLKVIQGLKISSLGVKGNSIFEFGYGDELDEEVNGGVELNQAL